MWSLVHEKQDEFIDQGNNVPAEEPTDWVSSLAYSWKANGKLWICPVPKDLNTAIKCDDYKTPTVEGITHELPGSTCFTKLDGTSSYLGIVLNYESSLFMIFKTPWGRFRFDHLPWSLACAQDIFQWMMDQILTHCDGVSSIADDVVVHGKDDKEHDKCLHKFMKVAHEHGLVFNKDKCAVKQTCVVFFRCVYDTTGAHPDHEKVSAVQKMPAPKAATQLQKILGLVIYLSPFIPSLSSFTAPPTWAAEERNRVHLEQLLSGSIWQVKSMVCKDTTLWYFDIHKPVTVEVDAFQKGLSATLLEEGCPVAFAAKALAPVEQHYAQHKMWTACLWSSENNNSTPMSLAMPSLLRVTTSRLNRSISGTCQTHQSIYRECCYNSKSMMSPSSIDLSKRYWFQMLCLAMHPSKHQRYL